MNGKDARSLSSEAQEALRTRAVDYYLACGNKSQTARAFGVSRQAVTGWARRYQEGGRRALRKKPQGRPKGGKKLKPWQMAQTAKAVTDKCPDQLKLPFMLWTRASVRDLIQQRFGVHLGLSSVGRYLRRWGFTPQKPLRRAYEQNPALVRRWLEQEYPHILRRAKRQKAQINWCDEMGLRSDHSAGRTYGRRCKTPVIRGTGRRVGCNMISAITNHGTLRFMVFKDRFCAEVFIEFLRRLVKQAGRKVLLIADRHPVHTSKRARKWVEEHRAEIDLFFLPGYSPDLNPDEYLNQDVKANAVGRRRPGDQQEMMDTVRSYLWSTQRRPDIVQNYFQAKPVRYAAA